MSSVIPIIAYLAAAVTLWATVCTINFMSSRTPTFTRVAYVLVGVGSMSVLLTTAFTDQQPGVGSAALSIGVAALLIAERIHARHVILKYAKDDGRLDHLCGPWWS